MSDSPEGPQTPLANNRPPRRRDEFEARAFATRDDIVAQVAARRAQFDQANERLEERTGRNLPLAILFGLVLGVSMLLSLIVVKELFMLVASALVAFTALELASALRFAGRDVPRFAAVAVSVAMVPAIFYFEGEGLWFSFLAAVVLLALARTAQLATPTGRVPAKQFWSDIGAGTLIVAYAPFLGGFGVLLTAQDGGEWWTLAFLIVVISTDTGAYASGLLFGKHPMAPRISPKKTWEGFAGSALVAVLAGVLLALFMLGQPWWFGLIFGLTMVATATVGDLTESLIKRDLGIKDISTWLPGHGGFLDRLDSVLPSAAAAYVLYLLFA
ncbi:phosphatidate cytidylyltransferase [Marisediminicola sp. LYQ134]|uniref:phosphatidate cytidylyltransferase n=1 Tax=unclassified Marisediminicola TaxID=2618316 RepID=UPI003983A79F